MTDEDLGVKALAHAGIIVDSLLPNAISSALIVALGSGRGYAIERDIRGEIIRHIDAPLTADLGELCAEFASEAMTRRPIDEGKRLWDLIRAGKCELTVMLDPLRYVVSLVVVAPGRQSFALAALNLSPGTTH